MNKLNPLLDIMCLVHTNLGSDLYECWKSQVVSGQLLNVWLHGCTEHVECLIVTDSCQHLMFFFENLFFSTRFFNLFRDLRENFVDRLFEIVVYHLICFVQNYKVTLIKHQSSSRKAIFDTAWCSDDNFNTTRDYR